MRVWLIPRVTALAALGVCQAAAAGPSWQLAGTTYNSVAFVDVNSVRREGRSRAFTAIRVSGQPTKDRWKSVVQKLSVNCDTRAFIDGGSRIENSDGSVTTYPGFGASQKAMNRGIFYDMFEIVCSGRSGQVVGDPKQWTLRKFKPGL
jgi:hypothetical protein